ncbi:MAG: 4-hydroxythreonine-4-phosphate dehydrogenase PdxA [Verrucomicrobiales bacterium]
MTTEDLSSEGPDILPEGRARESALPLIAVTMGDPAGVGPELCLRLLRERAVLALCRPVVIGDADVLRRVADVLSWPFDEAWVVNGLEEAPSMPTAIWHRPVPGLPEMLRPGHFTAETGAASFHFIEEAITAVQDRRVAGVTTGPINKGALHAAGIEFPGHTEIFAQRTGSKRWCMMQWSEVVTCTFVTCHVGYADVPGLVTPERVLEVIELTDSALRRLGVESPRLVVCGLNPHAGEGGLFGHSEEERTVVPAVLAARARGLTVEGPLPADTCFIPARRRTTDAYVCLYHDQGHIPLKALAFDSAVNTTLGLPVVRTSVDHGTAGDIAWKGEAEPGSLFAAVRLAVRLGADSSDSIRRRQ